jgi:hypothetical protein
MPAADPPQWIPVSSSWVERIAYDFATQRMWVKTATNPEPYTHDGVPPAKWRLFKAAASKGVFWNQHFKGRYPRR